MSLIGIFVVLCVIGILLWLANTKIPMDPTIRWILNAVVIGIVVIWLLQVTGAMSYVNQARLGAG